jgi:hypothetical protein
MTVWQEPPRALSRTQPSQQPLREYSMYTRQHYDKLIHASLQLLSKCAGLYNDYFKQSNEQHKYNTRNSTMLMWAIKEQTIANTLVVFNKGVSIWNCLDDEESKNINHIFLLRKLQNPITWCLIHVNISGILMTVFCNVLNIPQTFSIFVCK